MDGKLLVLCGERPTINDYGQRIDEQSNPLIKRGQKYYNKDEEEVVVDEHKKVISGMNLLNDIITESTEPDILFVDWETVVPSNIELMRKMVAYSRTTQQIPPEMILESGKNPSIMKRAHMDRLLTIERPSIDYQFQAMDDFLRLFSNALENNGVVSILPTFPKADDRNINMARLRTIQTWKDRNEMMAKLGKEEKIDILEPMTYNKFEEIYVKARDEMLKIISKPYWFENKSEEQEEGEPGGRD